METVGCDLCHHRSFEVVWNKQERLERGVMSGVKVEGQYGQLLNAQTVLCTNCGLLYTNPRMNQEDMDEFYQKRYREIYGDPNAQSESMHAQNAYNILQGAELLGLEHLDIGCATGELVALTQGEGLEPDPTHKELWEEKGITVHNYTLNEWESEKTYPLVTCLNTLEHMHSPSLSLMSIAELISKGGYLLLSVPDVYGKTLHIGNDAFFSSAHLYHFDQQTLLWLLEAHGFRVEGTWTAVESIGDKVYILATPGHEPRRGWEPFDVQVAPVVDFFSRREVAMQLKEYITRGLGFR